MKSQNWTTFFFPNNEMGIKNKKRIRIIQIVEFILVYTLWTWVTNVHLSSALVSFASSRVIICLLHSFDWVLVDELEPWPKERKKHSRNYRIEGHTNQFVNRNNWKFIEKKKNERWGGCNLSVTIRIPYNSDISRVWVSGEIHDRFGDKVSVTKNSI